MKLFNCTVELRDKTSSYSKTEEHSVLSLEKKVDYYKIEAYLCWKTEKENQEKYLIRSREIHTHIITKNLERFDSCLSHFLYPELKTKEINTKCFTLSFANPSHDLVIRNTDSASLEKFIGLVRIMCRGLWYSFHTLSSNVKSNFTLRNTKIDGRKRKYPLRKRFPRTPETLMLCGLNITDIDPKFILNLHNLRVLDLSNNQISLLPKELGTLPHLENLLLSHNCLGTTYLEIAKWEWMEQTAISQSLKELNISNNNLSELPVQIGKLQSLIILNVSQNLLTKVPQIIGTLQQLAKLDVSTNLLSYLPGSMRWMELEVLDGTNNPCKFDYDVVSVNPFKVGSLLDLAAKAVKKYRIPYNNLSSRMVRYLDNDKLCCICRNSCFHSDIIDFKPFYSQSYSDLLLDLFPRRCRSIIVPRDRLLVGQRLPYISQNMVFKCYFCSSKCFFLFKYRKRLLESSEIECLCENNCIPE